MQIVSVVIPTLNRPQPLRRAIASALAQLVPADVTIEVIVIDNSADGNAQQGVAGIVAPAGRQLTWISEPNPGVANARNSGARAAAGAWVAFLDDDEEASPSWLATLLGVASASGADAVFGPVDAQADEGGELGGFGPFFSRTIERPDGSDITDLSAYLGTNNSMFNKARCLSEAVPFDTSLNSTGGEDSLLLKRLVIGGARFAWAARAPVTEWVPPRRLTWEYVRKRKLLSGQIRVLVLHKLRPIQWSAIAWWMAVGAVQICVGAAAMLAFGRFSRARSMRATTLFYGGLGKLFWMPRFRPTLYGRGLVS